MVAPICGWCGGEDELQAFTAWWDFDPLRDAEPPLLWLCAYCRADGGMRDVSDIEAEGGAA